MSRKESIEIGLAGGALHWAPLRHRQSSARCGVGQTLGGRHVAQPATDECRAEAVPSSRRIEFLDLEPGLCEACCGVEVALMFAVKR